MTWDFLFQNEMATTLGNKWHRVNYILQVIEQTATYQGLTHPLPVEDILGENSIMKSCPTKWFTVLKSNTYSYQMLHCCVYNVDADELLKYFW